MVPLNRGQPGRSSAMEVDVHLRLQSQYGGIGHIAEANGRPVGLREC